MSEGESLILTIVLMCSITVLLNGIVWIFTGPIKSFFQLALGLPRNDPFFRYKGRNAAQKSFLFINMILKNIAMILSLIHI